MPRQILAIDVDDVIADSTESLRHEANSRFGLQLASEHYKVPGEYWGYYERVWRSHGIDESVTVADFDDAMIEDQSHVPILAGASFALSELSKSYDLVIITARNPSWKSATLVWLKNNFGDIFTDIYFTREHEEAEHQSKGEICRRLGVFCLVDDNSDHCQSAMNLGIDAVLFGEYGWHHDAPGYIKRCRDWPAVLDYFNGH